MLEASKYMEEVGNTYDSGSEEKWRDTNDSAGDTTRNIFKFFDDEEDI